MKDKQYYLKELEKIETIFSLLFEAKLEGYSDKDRAITVQIINDTVDLIKDLDRDMYMFYVSYENYDNGFSFMPQYYFENILLHDDMIWERLIVIIAIAYQIDFKIIFEKKSIYPLYNIVKKNNKIDIDIKRLLAEINADYNMKELKITRNGNEHFISSHLLNDDKISIKSEDIIYKDNGKTYGDIEKINRQTEYINKEKMKLLEEKIFVVSKKQEKYIDIMKLCIIQMECTLKKHTFIFNQSKYFLPNYEAKYVDKDININCKILENKYSNLRDELRTVINKINESIFAAMSNGSMIRYTLLIDSLYRAKEIIRSINIFFDYFGFYFNDKKHFDTKQIEIFEKYCCNDVIFPYYYYDHVILKFYSVYEKLAKFLLCKYDFHQEYLNEDKFKGMYIDKVIELFNKRRFKSDILNEFNRCVSSIEYQEYEKIRNREYHCLRVYYVLNEECRDLTMISNLSIIANMMNSLYNLYSLIITEENDINTKIISEIISKHYPHI